MRFKSNESLSPQITILLFSEEEKITSVDFSLPVIRATGFFESEGCHRNRVKSSDPETRNSGLFP